MRKDKPLKRGDLKRFCNDSGFTLGHLAREIGVTARTVTNWNSGEVAMPRGMQLAAFTVSAGFRDYRVHYGSAQQYLAIKDFAAIARLKKK